MDPYLELEISIDASDEEIKTQYRALAMIHHPDKGGDEEKFKRIKEAYEILSDPIRRKGYDMSGDAETNLQIRNSALDHIAQMMSQIVPNFDSEKDDLFAAMNLEVTKIRQSMFENIHVCNKYLENLDKVVVRINAKHNKQNIMLELVQKQIDQRKKEHEDFTKRIQICDLEIEILKDYEYGLVERIALPNTPSE
jgi:curved DNA-binding protein CbpA